VPNPQSGTLLGAYRVEGTIGSGSMGEVFRGIDTGLNRRVAIKLLSEKHRDSPELRQRFVREGRAVAAISHPNVVQVFATGSFDDRPYIAMELLDGADLGSIVEEHGALDSLSAAHAALDAAQGLAAAARAGLIHRDVKPSNLVRLTDGRVKVTDFGLAKPVDPGSEPALTAMGVVVGTPDYIAPEQARGEAIDERVDIYALGGTLYFLLVGVPPFRTGKPGEDKYLKVVARHLRNPAPDARQANPACDRELAELTRTMMAKKAADRPSYDELTAQLSQIIGRLDPEAVPMLVATSRERSRPNPMIPMSGPVVARGSVQADASKRGGAVPDDIEVPSAGLPGWLVALTFVCIALFVAGLVVYLRREGETGTSSANPPVAPTNPAAMAAKTADAPTAPAAATPGMASGGSAAAHDAAAAAAAGEARAPNGMVLVKTRDGSGSVYVDIGPVTVAAFRQVFAAHAQDGGPDAPVVMVSYNEARSYARTRGGRLLSSAEWDAAATTPGIQLSSSLFEWVETPGDQLHDKQVRRRGGPDGSASGSGRNPVPSMARPDTGYKDVTFRMAK
jgi:serine/threonine-protein kinase